MSDIDKFYLDWVLLELCFLFICIHLYFLRTEIMELVLYCEGLQLFMLHDDLF